MSLMGESKSTEADYFESVTKIVDHHRRHRREIKVEKWSNCENVSNGSGDNETVSEVADSKQKGDNAGDKRGWGR